MLAGNTLTIKRLLSRRDLRTCARAFMYVCVFARARTCTPKCSAFISIFTKKSQKRSTAEKTDRKKKKRKKDRETGKKEDEEEDMEQGQSRAEEEGRKIRGEDQTAQQV